MKYNQKANILALFIGVSQSIQLEHRHHHHHKSKDIGERKIDEEVHGFASADKNVLPDPRPRVKLPYSTNG